MKKMVLLTSAFIVLCASFTGVFAMMNEQSGALIAKASDLQQRGLELQQRGASFKQSACAYKDHALKLAPPIVLGASTALLTVCVFYGLTGKKIKLLERKIKETDNENELAALRKTLSSCRVRRRLLLVSILAILGVSVGYPSKKAFSFYGEYKKLSGENEKLKEESQQLKAEFMANGLTDPW